MENGHFEKAENVREVIKYLQKFKNTLAVIYIDDKIIESPLFSSHIHDIALIHEAGLKVIIIPGARRRIDDVLNSAKIDWTYKNNIRVTSNEAMTFIKMAAFDVSNEVMTNLAANHINALIGNWVRSRGIGILDGFDFGTAGEIDKLQINAINKVLDEGFVPIFPCIGWNSVGRPYNISSITLAQKVAMELKAEKLFFLMDSNGINPKLKNIPAMNISEVETFLNETSDSTYATRNVLKLAVKACENGVKRAHILDGNIDGALPCEIFSDLGSGTMIYTSNYGNIREMNINDIPEVLSLMRPFVENGKLLPRTEEKLKADYRDYVVYSVDGSIHGCAALHFYDDGQAEIAAVAVDNRFENMGVGPGLINYLFERAKKKNVSRIFILTTQAGDWFESLGFKKSELNTLPPARRKICSPERNSKVYRKNI